MDAKIITEKELSELLFASFLGSCSGEFTLWQQDTSPWHLSCWAQERKIDKSFVIMGFTRTYPKMVT